jgi:hypothetical protein
VSLSVLFQHAVQAFSLQEQEKLDMQQRQLERFAKTEAFHELGSSAGTPYDTPGFLSPAGSGWTSPVGYHQDLQPAEIEAAAYALQLSRLDPARRSSAAPSGTSSAALSAGPSARTSQDFAELVDVSAMNAAHSSPVRALWRVRSRLTRCRCSERRSLCRRRR